MFTRLILEFIVLSIEYNHIEKCSLSPVLIRDMILKTAVEVRSLLHYYIYNTQYTINTFLLWLCVGPNIYAISLFIYYVK